MESDDGFRSFSRAIASDPIGVLLAKWRRDVFIRKLNKLPDVVKVIPSGSLARGTQIGPVHDVDLIVVFDKSQHPGYGTKGRSQEAAESAQAAMTHLENGLLEQLHPWRGAAGGLLKETEQRTHVVTYRGDWAGPFKEIIPSAPPVDVMPAVQEGSHLLVPERGTGWVDVDPEKLIRQVEQRQREWKYFKEVVGMVKAWARHNHLKMKNLAVEVMVLKYCPRPGIFETMSCGEAVARFFEKAAKAHITSLEDPAKRSGKIDRHLDYGKLRSALGRAAVLSRQAMDAEHAWKNRYYADGEVIHPGVFWRELFGKKYPRTNKRFWRKPATEPWFRAEPAISTRLGDLGPNRPGGGPEPPDKRPPNEPTDRPPEGPDLGPDDPDPSPRGPGERPWHPRRPPGPGGPGRRPQPAPAEPAAGVWTGVFGPAAATPAVPLTFG